MLHIVVVKSYREEKKKNKVENYDQMKRTAMKWNPQESYLGWNDSFKWAYYVCMDIYVKTETILSKIDFRIKNVILSFLSHYYGWGIFHKLVFFLFLPQRLFFLAILIFTHCCAHIYVNNFIFFYVITWITFFFLFKVRICVYLKRYNKDYK